MDSTDSANPGQAGVPLYPSSYNPSYYAELNRNFLCHLGVDTYVSIAFYLTNLT